MKGHKVSDMRVTIIEKIFSKDPTVSMGKLEELSKFLEYPSNMLENTSQLFWNIPVTYWKFPVGSKKGV